MKRSANSLDRVAHRVLDLDSPAYGDERERAVIMESSTLGLMTGMYAGLLGALVSSVFGLLLLPVALLAMTVLPASVSLWYARRHGVDMEKLAERAGARSTVLGIVVCGTAVVLTFAAMTYTVFTGQAVLVPPSLDVSPGEGFLGGMAEGAVVGGMLGGLAAIIGGVHSHRRANRRRKAPGG